MARQRGSVKAKVTWRVGALEPDVYLLLDNMLHHPDEIPECVRNKTHNRYMDIIPSPETMIRLPELNSDPTTTYINANFVRSCEDDPRGYIAAQGFALCLT